MAKLERKLANLPIRQALLRIILVGTLIATAMILVFLFVWNTLLNLWATRLLAISGWNLLGFSANAVGIFALFGGAILGSFLILALVMRKTADVFYAIKLARPLEQLNYGVDQIQHQNLDFKLQNASHDELGDLARSFEKMRQALQEALQKSWQLLEDQKEVNAAFAHDLRTPLTVLQGDVEMLTVSNNQTNQQVLVQDMQGQLQRLTSFISLMSKITSLQTAPVEKHDCTSEQLVTLIKDEAAHTLGDCHFTFDIDDELAVDSTFRLATSAVLEVFDNQLSNAKKFTKSAVSITAGLTTQELQVTVVNDGQHLSKVELANVRVPFFSSQKAGHHLGVGMYICKVICETQGGSFTVRNVPEGVATIARFRIEQSNSVDR
ncbi:HAMP domain-containing sensor histidine kinase [Lacticaseibacillus zhaodongensis]|uniref:HAMP domain-containing sensor histidine kinase n=1 Tax=Lacticaseibacillus zhaodongensis TaxID=2668065 RepID=UPI0012D2D9A8|nr:HAMP domain-containing sensor histidine kinase [Lacticaseibacillus zhaodongensis]